MNKRILFFWILSISSLIGQSANFDANIDITTSIDTTQVKIGEEINYKINNLQNSKLNELTNSWCPYNSIACLLLWESIENKVFFKT